MPCLVLEPFLVRRAGEGGIRPRQQPTVLVGVVVGVGGVGDAFDPHRFAATGGEQRRDVDEGLRAGTGNLRERGCARPGGRLGVRRHVHERLGDRARGDQLRLHVRHVPDAVLPSRPGHERLHELVELRRAQDPDRERPLQHRLLVDLLRGEEAGAEAVDADDRDDDQPLHACLRTELVQVPRRRDEELRGRPLLGRRVRSGVDHRLHPRERLRQPLAGHDVDAEGAGHRDDLVPALLEHVDDMGAEPPGRACDCDPLACVHHAPPSRSCLRREDERGAREGTARPTTRRTGPTGRSSGRAGLASTSGPRSGANQLGDRTRSSRSSACSSGCVRPAP